MATGNSPGSRQGRAGRTNGKALTGVPTFTPVRDRAVSPKAVKCPTCDAAPTEDCRSMGTHDTPKGDPCYPHSTRRRMAVRADNLAREKAAGEPPPLGGYEVAPDPAIPPCPSCGRTIRLTGTSSGMTRRLRHKANGDPVHGGKLCPGSSAPVRLEV